MNFWNSWFGDAAPECDSPQPLPELGIINPATGLPMTSPGHGGVDVGGSPYGSDIHASPSQACGIGGFDPFG